MAGHEGFSMGPRSFAGRLGLCAALLVAGEAIARERTSEQPTSRTASQASSEVRDWLSAVVTKIADAEGGATKTPRGKGTGTVTIRLQIAADGFVNRVMVEKSSGSPDLDARALSLVRTASPFSPPPAPLLTEAGMTELAFPLRLGR
jgi:TonB family protein